VSALIAHYDNTPFWISADTDTLNDLEYPIQLKVHVPYGRYVVAFGAGHAAASLRYLEMSGHLEYYIIIKALNGFLMIQRQMLADSVDTSLASLLYSCITDAVFSEVHDQGPNRERRA